MSKKVCICILNASDADNTVSSLRQRVSDEGFEISEYNFSDTEDFALKAVNLKGNVIAACPADKFCSAKIAISSLLMKKFSKSASIIKAMDGSRELEQGEYNIQTAIPEGGKAYPTADGLYSAFSCPTSSGTLFFIPLDEERTEYILNSGILSAINPQAKSKAGNAVSDFKEKVEGIIGSGKSVAVSLSSNAKPLIAAVSSVPGWDKVFKPDFKEAEKKKNESAEDFCARASKEAMESCETELGMNISDAYDDGEGGSYIAVSVSDGKRASGARVYSKPGENSKRLLSAALIKSISLLEDAASNGIPEPQIPTAKRNRNQLLPVIIGIAVGIIVCIIIAVSSFAIRDRLADNAVKAANAYAVEDEDSFNPKGGVGLDDSEIRLLEEQANENPVQAETTAYISFAAPLSKKITTVTSTVKQLTTTVITTLKATTLAETTAVSTTVTPTTTVTIPSTTAITGSTTAAEKVTTTVSASTTLPAKATNASAPAAGASGSGKGKWVFRVYGWGHGVGMSQKGAIKMSKNGSSYIDILQNYFTGCSVKTDASTPTMIKYGGKDIPIVEYLCKATYAEIGSGSYTEALKAQIVCIYTFAKYYNFNVASDRHAYKSGYDYKDTSIYKACLSVLGMASESDVPKGRYVDYGGKAAFTCYFDTSAGKTASADSVWGGGEKYPYLKGGNPSPEDVEITTKEITVDEMKAYIQSYAKDNGKTINLDPNPENWLEIVSHDGAYNSTTGYVDYIRVGDIKVRGNAFRCNVVDFAIRSHCFTMEYVPG